MYSAIEHYVNMALYKCCILLFFIRVPSFCRDCMFLDVINALTRLQLPECDARIKVRLGFLEGHTVGPHFLL